MVKKLRIVHGAVSMVRAIPSREVSVITVEIPEEHHVQATMLVHGQHVLILRSALASGTKYGIHDVDLGAGSTDPLAFAAGQVDENQDVPTILHAVVAMVRPFPSRMISSLYLEVPDSHHIEVTNLLHGRDAILFPVKLPKAPLGIMKPGALPPSLEPSKGIPARKMSETPRLSGGSRSAGGGTAPSATGSAPPSGLLGRHEKTIVATRWLGIHCPTESFQDWLGVRNEAAARNKVCEMCGVSSRAEIHFRDNPAAFEAFLTKVFNPFDSILRQPAAAEHSGEDRPRRETPSA